MRPDPTRYATVAEFFRAMAQWRKETGGSSLRAATAGVRRCSPSLVSQVLAGKRTLTLDRLDAFAEVFALTAEEKVYVRRWIQAKSENRATDEPRPKKARKSGENHVFSHWLHPIVKDASRVTGFRPEPEALQKMFGSLASEKQLARSLVFLLREGYLRRTLDGRVVENDVLVTTTDEIPSESIRAFHRKATELVSEKLPEVSVNRRQSATVTLPLTQSSFLELKALLKEFYERVLAFAEEHPEPGDALYLFTMHLMPLSNDEAPADPPGDSHVDV